MFSICPTVPGSKYSPEYLLTCVPSYTLVVEDLGLVWLPPVSVRSHCSDHNIVNGSLLEFVCPALLLYVDGGSGVYW